MPAGAEGPASSPATTTGGRDAASPAPAAEPETVQTEMRLDAGTATKTQPVPGRSVLSFEALRAGGTLAFAEVELDAFPPVETELFFGKEQADVFVFRDAFYERLEKALGKKFELVHLHNGGVERASVAFVYHLDDTVRGIELAKDPTLEAWLVAFAEPFGKTSEHSISTNSMNAAAFTRWDSLVADPSAMAIEHAPTRFKKPENDDEKRNYFAFAEPKVEDSLYSKERFEVSLSSFLKTRKTSTTDADVEPLLELQKRIAAPLPGDLVALYESTGELPKVFFGFDLMSTKRVSEEWQGWQEIYDEWTLDALQSQQEAEPGVHPVYISPRWIPIIDLVGGNYLAVDLGPKDGAPYGQVIVAGRDVHNKRRVADGVTELLEKAATYDGSKTHALYDVFGELRF